jgi:hypothetical protein
VGIEEINEHNFSGKMRIYLLRHKGVDGRGHEMACEVVKLIYLVQ